MHAMSYKLSGRAMALLPVNGTLSNFKYVDSKIFTRSKRTSAKNKSNVSPQTQRIVTQLSVMSARKKQPRMLKLSKEDLIKHQTIQRAWDMYQGEKSVERSTKLQRQYQSIDKAMNILKEVSPQLFKLANINESGKLFPLEMKLPANYPSRKIWHYDYKPKE